MNNYSDTKVMLMSAVHPDIETNFYFVFVVFDIGCVRAVLSSFMCPARYPDENSSILPVGDQFKSVVIKEWCHSNLLQVM